MGSDNPSQDYKPGPWSAAIVTGPDGKDWIGVGAEGKPYPRLDKVHALCGPCHGKYENESIADARLIAAAPDLLEACKIALTTIEDAQAIIGTTGEGSQDEEAARTLRSAISKAEGR